jgi:hypothetical protein
MDSEANGINSKKGITRPFFRTQQEWLTGAGFIVEQNEVLSSRGKWLGLINPAAYLRFREKNSCFAYGHAGYYCLNNITRKELRRRLFACGFLFPCTQLEAGYILKLLSEHPLSRSISWLLNLVKDFRTFKKLWETIPQTKIQVIGCGGIGSNVVFLLTGLGYTLFSLWDGDTIDLS